MLNWIIKKFHKYDHFILRCQKRSDFKSVNYFTCYDAFNYLITQHDIYGDYLYFIAVDVQGKEIKLLALDW